MTDHYDKLEIRDPAERERDMLAALPKQVAQAQTATSAFKKILDGPAATLRENEDVREFYLGTGGSGGDGERKSYRAVKSYKRRKRWLA